MATLSDIIKTSTLLNEQIRSVSGDALLDYFVPIFDADKRIHAIVWEQYAPYFNDGSPCVFGVCVECALRAKGHEGNTYADRSAETGLPADLDKVDRQAVSMIHALPLDFLKRITEDGAIIVTRSAVEIEEVEHD